MQANNWLTWLFHLQLQFRATWPLTLLLLLLLSWPSCVLAVVTRQWSRPFRSQLCWLGTSPPLPWSTWQWCLQCLDCPDWGQYYLWRRRRSSIVSLRCAIFAAVAAIVLAAFGRATAVTLSFSVWRRRPLFHCFFRLLRLTFVTSPPHRRVFWLSFSLSLSFMITATGLDVETHCCCWSSLFVVTFPPSLQSVLINSKNFVLALLLLFQTRSQLTTLADIYWLFNGETISSDLSSRADENNRVVIKSAAFIAFQCVLALVVLLMPIIHADCLPVGLDACELFIGHLS